MTRPTADATATPPADAALAENAAIECLRACAQAMRIFDRPDTASEVDRATDAIAAALRARAVPDGHVVIHRRLFDAVLSAFRLIDDSEENAQTGFISIDCEIGQRALADMSSVFVDMEVESIEDLRAMLAASKEAK